MEPDGRRDVAGVAHTRGTKVAETLDDDQAEMGARVLQGVVLDTTATVEDQLRFALSQNLTRVKELFEAWDENGDGKVSKREFRRAVALLGLRAPKKDVDDLFDSFDPDSSGTIEFREINAMLRQREEKKPLPVVPKLGGNHGKWGNAVAKVVVGNKLGDMGDNSIDRLREVLKQNAGTVVAMFKKMDVNGDGRITRGEFTRALPRLELSGERFTSKDADSLFTAFDKDRSGSIDYRELNKELRENARHAATPEQVKMASKLLSKTDLVVVIGAPTRSKQQFCARLAYTFKGTWLSMRALAEREVTAGSRAAGEIGESWRRTSRSRRRSCATACTLRFTGVRTTARCRRYPGRFSCTTCRARPRSWPLSRRPLAGWRCASTSSSRASKRKRRTRTRPPMRSSRLCAAPRGKGATRAAGVALKAASRPPRRRGATWT